MRAVLIVRRTVYTRGIQYCCQPRAFSSSSIQHVSSKPTRTLLSTSIAEDNLLPRFLVPSSHVQLIEQPSNFYEELLAIISRAQKRIFIASLYIGKTETELISHLRQALDRRSQLQVTILVDSLRSTREGQYRGGSRSSSCASLLARLQQDYPKRVQVRLFRAPGLPSWLEKLVGKRFVEGWGLQHMKIYGGDDEVMISGANLSNDYFTNRRDRYVRIKDTNVSQYMYSLLMVAARYSYSIQADANNVQGQDESQSNHSSYQLSWDEGRNLPMSIDEHDYGPVSWKGAMKKEVQNLTKNWHEKHQAASSYEKETPIDSVQIVPLLQMGPLDIKQETTCVPLILRAVDSPSARLDFTTGYFSINPEYARLILQGKFRSDMITASPRANGFYGSKGISGYLPAAYTWLESLFWKKLKAQKRDQDVIVREWSKSGWTYHAKGVWLTTAGNSTPTVTLLGSSNFGTRSALLDLECTLIIDATNSSTMQERLKEEVQELRKDADDAVGEEMFQREERKVHWGVKVAAWFIKKML